MKILAITSSGTEYLFRASSAHAVPVSSAEKIRSALNGIGFRLRPGETWHLYDVGPYDGGYDYAELQRFYIRSGRIYERGL